MYSPLLKRGVYVLHSYDIGLVLKRCFKISNGWGAIQRGTFTIRVYKLFVYPVIFIGTEQTYMEYMGYMKYMKYIGGGMKSRKYE